MNLFFRLKASIICKFIYMSVIMKNMNSIYLFLKKPFMTQNLNIDPDYKWETSNKLILKIEHITFLMI